MDLHLIDIKKVLKEMTFEEKCLLLTCEHDLGTHVFEKYGIPLVMFSDGPHGIRRLINHPRCPQECNIKGGDTALPTASAVGASWNEQIAFDAGATIAADCIEEGVDMLLAPGVNMKRTPHCGRNFEYYSEDPYLSGMLAAAFINGVQSKGVGTSLKHYAANNQEILRGSINAEIDERTLREYYLKVFEIALSHSNPTSVMCSYNRINGIWASENRYLLKDILKDEWKYDGMVISDWGAVHDISKCIKAGLDFQAPKNADIVSDIREGIKKGVIDEADLDRAVESVLKYINKIISMKKPPEKYDRRKQHEAAYKAACETITLLRNERNILPITPKKYKKIAVMGEFAKSPLCMGGGSSRVTVDDSFVDTPFDYIAENANGMICDYIPLRNGKFYDESMLRSVERIRGKYDLYICFAGDNYGTDCETESFDRDNLKFPNYMNAVIQKCSNDLENFVLVTQVGGAVIPFGWAHTPAIVQMWYSGEACGRAIADILFGKVNPSGKLSETFMLEERTNIDYPGDGTKVCYDEKLNCGYRYYDKHPEKIWFPFGHGISYTDFEYSDISLSADKFETNKFKIKIRFKLKNIGNVRGKETAQLYVACKDSVVERPPKELRRFKKTELLPGEEQTKMFELDNTDFEYFNLCLREWTLESGSYEILIGASSRDIRLKEEFYVKYDNDYTTLKHNDAMVL